MSQALLKIFWIDDDHEDMQTFKAIALDHGIEFICYKSLEGLKELEQNYHLFDGVLLDAKFYQSATDSKGAENRKYSMIARDRILKLPKKFEIFVLTGQEKAYMDESYNMLFEENRIFKKGVDSDEDRLFESLIVAAKNQPDTQIKQTYYEVFEFLEQQEFPSERIKFLIDILKGVHQSENIEDGLYFTQLRIFLEHLFRIANKVGLLHDKCIKANRQVNLTESSLFLSGMDTNHIGVRCKKKHFPKIISDSVRSILFISGDASHTAEVDIHSNINVQEFRASLKTPYLLNSLTYQLLDFILWFKHYLKFNSDFDLNKSYWEEVNAEIVEQEWLVGEIVKIENNWGTFQPNDRRQTISIPPALMQEGNFLLQEKVRLKTTPGKNNKTFTEKVERI